MPARSDTPAETAAAIAVDTMAVVTAVAIVPDPISAGSSWGAKYATAAATAITAIALTT